MSFQPKGVIPAMITPLTQDKKVNEKELRKLVNFLIDNGSHGIFAAGTTGEFYGLTHEQSKEVIEITIDEAGGRVPIYAGAAAITTEETLKLVRIAEDCRADAVSVLTPMFISPSQQELYTHYEILAKSTSLPVILYNNLPKTSLTITADTVVQLADIENIVGIKDSTGDFTLTAEYIRRTREKDFSVVAGRDTLIHACLCYGGAGAIAACGNLAPRLVADIYDKFIEGDKEGSLEAQFALAPLRMAFKLGSFPTIMKEGLELLGIDAGPCFGPIGTMSKEEKKELKKVLKQVGIL